MGEKFVTELGKLDYQPPSVLQDGSLGKRESTLRTGGSHSRRAYLHVQKGELKQAVADVLRGIARPGQPQNAKLKLTAVLEDILRKAEKKREEARKNGDIRDLLEDLEMADDGDDLKEVDQKKLKRTYRELSVKYHPDKSRESLQRFNRVRDAYEILSDPVKVVLYDTGGPELVKKFEKGRSELETTENAELTLQLTL